MVELIGAHLKINPGHGFGLLFDEALRPTGWGKTRAWHVYKALKLNLQRCGKRRRPDQVRNPLEVPAAANHTWSADFMSDALWSGRRFRTFNVNDDFNRESLRMEVDTSPPSTCVVRALDGNPPIFSSRQKWSYAAIASFCIGVMPPSAMFGRSWLYVHSQRVALSCTWSMVSNRVRASQP